MISNMIRPKKAENDDNAPAFAKAHITSGRVVFEAIHVLCQTSVADCLAPGEGM